VVCAYGRCDPGVQLRRLLSPAAAQARPLAADLAGGDASGRCCSGAEIQGRYQVWIEGKPMSNRTYFGREVYRTVVECEAGAPLPPLAPYPL
jgi:hypothetical protein